MEKINFKTTYDYYENNIIFVGNYSIRGANIMDESELLDFFNNHYGKINSFVEEFPNYEEIIKQAFINSKQDDFSELYKHEDYHVRLLVIANGYHQEDLIHDSNINVRRYLAERGFGKNEYITDKDDIVRANSLKYHKNYKDYINDSFNFNRYLCAMQGIFSDSYDEKDYMILYNRIILNKLTEKNIDYIFNTKKIDLYFKMIALMYGYKIDEFKNHEDWRFRYSCLVYYINKYKQTNDSKLLSEINRYKNDTNDKISKIVRFFNNIKTDSDSKFLSDILVCNYVGYSVHFDRKLDEIHSPIFTGGYNNYKYERDAWRKYFKIVIETPFDDLYKIYQMRINIGKKAMYTKPSGKKLEVVIENIPWFDTTYCVVGYLKLGYTDNIIRENKFFYTKHINNIEVLN